MIHIQIGQNSEKRQLEDATESWIHEQLYRRRRDGPVCVKIYIEKRGLNIVLASCDCLGRSSRRPLTEAEAQIVDLWTSLGLHLSEFAPEQLIRFLKQLRSRGFG